MLTSNFKLQTSKVFLFWSLIFSLWSLVFGLWSFAQEVPRFYGEEVVVTAARIPQLVSRSPWNTSVITSQELKNFRTVGEALRVVAGVDSIAYGYLGAVNSVRLRGANASQVLVLVDGRRINSPTLGMFDMGDLLIDNVEKIEVVRAPLSAVYGSDAVSGVINIITKSPKEPERSFFVSAGSFGTNQYKLSIGGENYLFFADYLKVDGFRQNSAYLAKNISGRIEFPIATNKAIIDVSYYDALKGVPNVPTSEADPASATEPNDRQTDKNVMAGVGLKGNNFKLRIYQSVLDQKLDPYIFGASTNQTWQTGFEWQQNLGVGIGNVLYGLEAREDKGKTTMSGEHAIRNYALFVQDEIELGNRYVLTASMRGDKHSTAGTSINPRVGMVYQPIGDLIVRASAGTAFRAPTLNELYWNDPAWMQFGDPNLKPEKAVSYDIGLERKFGEASAARINYFVSTITDLILWDWKSSSLETRVKNVGEVYSEGIEFELARKIGKDGKGFVNYTYQKAVDRKDFDPLAVDKTICYTPQTKYNAGLIYGDGSVLVKHVGERWADLYNTIKLPAYTVVDLRFSKKTRDFVLELAIDNLLDESYSEVIGNDPTTSAARKYPMPGRRYTLGVSYTL